jgi:RNA polymerase sigma-70 factor, ECF subfamily
VRVAGLGHDETRADALQTVEDLERLYDQHKAIAYGLAFQMLREQTAAEDVVQEAFLAAWRARSRYDFARGGLRGWLLAIVRNRAIDRLRHDRLVPLEVLEPETADLLADDSADPARLGPERLWIRKALALLPEAQRRAILLAYFGGYTQTQIARRTGQPHGTVKGQLRLGLLKLAALDLATFSTMVK